MSSQVRANARLFCIPTLLGFTFSFLSVIPSLAFVSIGCCRENIVFLPLAAKKKIETNVAVFPAMIPWLHTMQTDYLSGSSRELGGVFSRECGFRVRAFFDRRIAVVATT